MAECKMQIHFLCQTVFIFQVKTITLSRKFAKDVKISYFKTNNLTAFQKLKNEKFTFEITKRRTKIQVVDVVCKSSVDVDCKSSVDVVCKLLLDVFCKSSVDVVCKSSIDVVCKPSADVVCKSSVDVFCKSSADVVCKSSVDVVCKLSVGVICKSSVTKLATEDSRLTFSNPSTNIQTLSHP